MGASSTQTVRRAMIKTGIYTGDGNDLHNIYVGIIDFPAKNNVYMIIKSLGAHKGHHRIEYGQGDLTMSYDAGGDNENKIQLFRPTGFQVGSHAEVNADGIVYRYIIIWEEP